MRALHAFDALLHSNLWALATPTAYTGTHAHLPLAALSIIYIRRSGIASHILHARKPQVTDGLPMEPVRHFRVGGYRWGDMASVAKDVPESIRKYYNIK